VFACEPIHREHGSHSIGFSIFKLGRPTRLSGSNNLPILPDSEGRNVYSFLSRPATERINILKYSEIVLYPKDLIARTNLRFSFRLILILIVVSSLIVLMFSCTHFLRTIYTISSSLSTTIFKIFHKCFTGKEIKFYFFV
jgi:hypothetical protein